MKPLRENHPQVTQPSKMIRFSSLKGTPLVRKLEGLLDGFIDKQNDVDLFLGMVQRLFV